MIVMLELDVKVYMSNIIYKIDNLVCTMGDHHGKPFNPK